MRQRIDGVLFDAFEIPKHMQEQVLTRIKVLGGMDIAEKRLPQDGRATIHVGDREIDLRIASLPTSHNERIVIRLLDKSARLYRLDELGMGAEVLTRFRQLIRIDHGLLLVTGPTGSGKSTTLYASLLEVNTAELNVLSIEDPIEYQLDGVSQTPINEKKGMTFAAGLRSVLRQDPDIIMVGEIRDRDTASMAVQASLTGHLVFSTLHTNDAASAVTRLLDLGTEPYLVSSSLVAVLAQRLVRRICENCMVIDDATETLQLLHQLDPQSESQNVQPRPRRRVRAMPGYGIPRSAGDLRATNDQRHDLQSRSVTTHGCIGSPAGDAIWNEASTRRRNPKGPRWPNNDRRGIASFWDGGGFLVAGYCQDAPKPPRRLWDPTVKWFAFRPRHRWNADFNRSRTRAS